MNSVEAEVGKDWLSFNMVELLSLAGVAGLLVGSVHEGAPCKENNCAGALSDDCVLGQTWSDLGPTISHAFAKAIKSKDAGENFAVCAGAMRPYAKALIMKLIAFYASQEEGEAISMSTLEVMTYVFYFSVLASGTAPPLLSTGPLTTVPYIAALRQKLGDAEAYRTIVAALGKLHDMIDILYSDIDRVERTLRGDIDSRPTQKSGSPDDYQFLRRSMVRGANA